MIEANLIHVLVEKPDLGIVMMPRLEIRYENRRSAFARCSLAAIAVDMMHTSVHKAIEFIT